LHAFKNQDGHEVSKLHREVFVDVAISRLQRRDADEIGSSIPTNIIQCLEFRCDSGYLEDNEAET
jgi:hypothetical protein